MGIIQQFGRTLDAFSRASGRFNPREAQPLPNLPTIPQKGQPETRQRGYDYVKTVLDGLKAQVFGSESLADIRVTNETTLSLPPAWACISYISEGLAMLDREVLKQKDSGTYLAENHPLFDFFATTPHPYYTWFDFLAAMAVNACLGNAYARIHWDGSTMRPLHLELLPSYMVQVDFDMYGELYYHISGEMNGRLISLKLPYTDVIHIKGLTMNGLNGRHVAMQHKETIGAGMAAIRYSSSVLGKGARPSIAIKSSDSLDTKEVELIENNILSRHGGSENAGRPLVLDNNMEIQFLQWSPQEVALVDFSALTIQQCCQIFKVPADMLAMPGTGTYSSTKVRSLDFLKLCIWPWKEKFEEEFNRKLFWKREFSGRKVFFQFNTAIMQEADRETEANTLAIMIQNKIMTPNEARKRLGFNPLEGGDDLFGDINYLPLKSLVEVSLAKYLSSEGEKNQRLNTEPEQQPTNTQDDAPQPANS